MNAVVDSRCRLWKFPFKPVRVPESILSNLNLNNYTMEKKFDGWRTMIVQDTNPSLWTREKVSIAVPKNLESQLCDLRLPFGTVLDGEIWNPLKRGSWRHDKKVRCKITVWDVVRAGDKDVSLFPIERRREILREILQNTPDIDIVQPMEVDIGLFGKIRDEAQKFWNDNNCRSGFIHGVVLKRKTSPRRDHATRCVEHVDWLKIIFDGMSGWAPRNK